MRSWLGSDPDLAGPPARRPTHEAPPAPENAALAEEVPERSAAVALQKTVGNAALARLVDDRLRGRPRQRQIQRFDEPEHKAIGDRAMAEVRFKLAPLVTASYGDFVALGDYFRDIDELASLVGTPGSSKGTIGEVYYALFVRVQGGNEAKHMGDFYDESAKKAVLDRYYQLAGRNISHFPNPFTGDPKRPGKEKAGRHDPQGYPVGALSTYRDAHLRAIRRAIELGAGRRPIGGALAIDAFGAHFLTDAFSAGHARTPRLDIVQHWQKRVPGFYSKFLRWMANEVAFFIDHAGSQGEQLWPVDDFLGLPGKRRMALDSIKAALKGMPEMTFGDVVALAVHDYDSERGVVVKIAGKRLKLVGDGRLLEPDGKGGTRTPKEAASTMEAAVRAVKESAEEVEKAYDYGRAGLDEDAVVEKLTARWKGQFAAERLIPVPVPDVELGEEDKSLRWGFETVDELFEHRPMRRALVVFANRKAATFDSIIADPKIAKVARQALEIRVANRMASTDSNVIVELLKEVLNHKG